MTKPYAHIVGQRDGEDLHAFEVGLDFTAVAMQRLGRAIVLYDLRVINTFYVRPPPGPHHTIWMEVTIPASKVEAAKAELGRSVSSCGPPARPTAGIHPPTPTWGELRDQVDALLREHRGPMLPCGHPPWHTVELRQIGPRRMVVERRSDTRCESVEIDVPPKGVTAHFAGCMLGVFVCCKGDTLIMRIIGNTTGRGRVLSGMTEDIPTARVFVVAPFDHAPIPFPNFHDGEVHDG